METRLLLSRYDSGDASVWDELHAIPDVDVLDPRSRREVEDVVASTVERATQNVYTLYESLAKDRFVFSSPQWARPSNDENEDILKLLAGAIGPIPLVLEAWLKRITLVSFRGHPSAPDAAAAWDKAVLDPFEFLCDRGELEMTIHDWRQDAMPVLVPGIPDGCFSFEIGGDTYHKNDVSGGAATCIVLPSKSVDALVFENPEQSLNGGKGIWFVDYLRSYFDGGGFRETRVSRPNSKASAAIHFEELLPI